MGRYCPRCWIRRIATTTTRGVASVPSGGNTGGHDVDDGVPDSTSETGLRKHSEFRKTRSSRVIHGAEMSNRPAALENKPPSGMDSQPKWAWQQGWHICSAMRSKSASVNSRLSFRQKMCPSDLRRLMVAAHIFRGSPRRFPNAIVVASSVMRSRHHIRVRNSPQGLFQMTANMKCVTLVSRYGIC
jgi:hypothetical protein